MERRDWSLKALNELIYADSLDSYDKADALSRWYDTYIQNESVEKFDLELEDLKRLEELFFKSISFLKKHKKQAKKDLDETKKMRKFLNH